MIADFPDEELLESVSQYYEHFDVNSSADASELSSEMEDIYDDLSSFSSTSSSDDDDAAEDEEESDDDGEDAIEESETQSTESEKTRAAPSLVAGEAAVDSGRFVASVSAFKINVLISQFQNGKFRSEADIGTRGCLSSSTSSSADRNPKEG